MENLKPKEIIEQMLKIVESQTKDNLPAEEKLPLEMSRFTA